MEALDVSRYVVRNSGLTIRAVAAKAGRSSGMYDQYIYRRHVPSVRMMAEICDACEFDLLVRNRRTGEEEVIDPPTRD